MTRIRIALTAVALGAAALIPAQAGAKTVLKGTVGPGFTISLKNPAGRQVTTLKRGVYAITVTDRASDHNFHLRGPGVNKVITGIAFRGTKTVVVTLRPGRYTYVCDPHLDVMRKTFRVVA